MKDCREEEMQSEADNSALPDDKLQAVDVEEVARRAAAIREGVASPVLQDTTKDVEEREDDDEEEDDDEQEDDEDDDEDEGSMSLIAHLEELRERIIRCLIALGIGTAVCYYFIEDIMHLITAPAGKLYYMYPAEAFFTYLKISGFAGFLLMMPYIFYQVWKFVLPALTVREKTIIGIIVPVSVLLFVGGLAFSFFLVMPLALKFFLGFGTPELQPMLSLNRYFDFVIAFILPFGLVFELPLAIVVMAKLGIIGSKYLKEKRRMVIFMSFVIGAVISPTPDVFTQSMIAVPMILLYEISLLIVSFVLRK